MQKYFFPGARWDKFLKDTCRKLSQETVLLTGLPHIGLTTFLKYVESCYKSIIKKQKPLIVYLDIINKNITAENLSQRIVEKFNYKLNYPNYLKSLDCEESVYELIRRGKDIIIIINRFQLLRKAPQAIDLLHTLRAENSIKVRFLIGCNTSCLAKPQTYKRAGTLVSANQIIIPTLTREEILLSLRNYQKLFTWNVPKKYTEEIYNLSGGICGLVKYCAKFIHENSLGKIILEEIINYPSINYKIKDIYETLRENDLIKRRELNSKKVTILKKLKVLDRRKSIRIGLLEPFILGEGIEKIENKDLEKILSPQELTLFNLLLESSKTLTSLDDIAKSLWGDHTEVRYSLWAIYKNISKLNKKVKKLGYQIKNYRGRGYQLVQM